jgi:exosortase/archaeosortase family protein
VVARVSGACVSLFDPQVRVQSVFITGRQSLQIVLDCAALDALALFAATVLAFPASVRVKLTGLIAGVAIISTFNVLRIVILYAAGMKSHDAFTFLHEDVMALLIVLVSLGCFAAWAMYASPARPHSPRVEASASTPA